MRQQHPGVVDRDSELMSVMLVSKTRGGQGTATLKVGPQTTTRQTVAGNRTDVKSISDSSYDRTLFKNPKANSRGAWQIHTRGRFNVRQAVVEIGVSGLDLSLDYADLHVRTGAGDNGILRLRNKARQDHGIRTQDYELEKVTIIGKSRRGNGTATLFVGNAASFSEVLDGNPQKFVQKNLGSFDVVEIQNPKVNSNGSWQIELQGNIKIREVKLHMIKK